MVKSRIGSHSWAEISSRMVATDLPRSDCYIRESPEHYSSRMQAFAAAPTIMQGPERSMTVSRGPTGHTAKTPSLYG